MPRNKQERDVSLARTLRQQLSLPEVLLWQHLRRAENVKFRRQHPIGRYVLDFYCARSKVCIEIDGIGHEMGDQAERDRVRDRWLAAQGIEVVRVPAAEVLRSPGEVAEVLVRLCER